jgi:hypothetical protein
MKIKNIHRESLDFVVAGKAKDGVPPTASLAPGEEDEIDLPDNDYSRDLVKARVAAGMIEVSGAGAKAVASSAPAAAAAPAAERRK